MNDPVFPCKNMLLKMKSRKEWNMANRLYCRAFQTGMKIGNYFLGYRTPEYIEGPDSVKK